MSYWNFRVIFHDSDPRGSYYGLHEVYYSDDGMIEKWTEKAFLVGVSVEDLAKEIQHISDDIHRFPEALILSELEKK